MAHKWKAFTAGDLKILGKLINERPRVNDPEIREALKQLKAAVDDFFNEDSAENMTEEIPAEIIDLYRTMKQNPGSGIAFFSDKYTDKEIIQMLLSLESGIELKEIQSGSADPGRLADAVKSLRRENLYIKDGQQTTYEVAKSLYILKKKYNVETACFCCDALKDGFISILTLAVTIGVNVAFPEDEYDVL